MSRRALFLVVPLLAGLIASSPVSAQVDYSTATLKGTVLDPQQLLVAGANVTIRNPNTGFAKTLTTGADGLYRFPSLTPGTYQVQAEATGFAKAAGTVTLSVGQIADFDFHLKVGSATAMVEVSGEMVLVQVEQTQQANTISERSVSELPNITRNFTDSVFTLPGVGKSEAPRAQNPGFSNFQSSGFSIGGSNGRNNLVTIDGGENDYGSGQLRTPNVPVDSIQEFQVNRSSFAAEFGFTSGTAVNIVTRSGANKFHGSAYAYFRNNATDASNYFAPSGPKAYEQNFVPGFTFSGPIIKNKLFVFTSYEFRKTDTPQFRSYLTSPAALGIASNSKQQQYLAELLNTGNPLLQRVAGELNYLLTPSNFANTAKLLGPNTGTFNDWKRFHNWVTRLDYTPGSNDTLTARFSLMRDDASRMYILDPLNSPDDATFQYWKDYTILGAWSHIFSTNLLNQLRVQVVPSDDADVPVASPNTSYLTLGSLGNFQGEQYEPYHALQRRFQFEDSVSWSKGHHTLKFGGSYRPVSYRVSDQLWFGGRFDFFDGRIPVGSPFAAAFMQTDPAGVAAFFAFNAANGYFQEVGGQAAPVGPAWANLSAIQSFDVGIPAAYRQGFGNPQWEDWSHTVGFYMQDSWKVSHSFSIDFGGRVDWNGDPAPLKHHTYLSPRLGFAWSPGGKTVIRGGGGIFYAPVPFYNYYIMNILGPSGQYINQVATDVKQYVPLGPGGTSVPATVALWQMAVSQGIPVPSLNAAEVATVVPPGQGVVVVEPSSNFQAVHSVQASLSVQRELTRNMTVEVAYQMYHGLHQQIPYDSNVREIPWGDPACKGIPSGQPITAQGIDPFVGPCYTQINPALVQLETYASIGSSIYHGMTASLTRRFNNGLQFQANYTFSKTIDDNTDFNNNFMPFRPTRLDMERGLSSFNIKHNFVTSAVYMTPFKAGGNVVSRVLADMTISPVLYLRTGIPFTVRIPGLDNGTLGQSLYARPWGAARNTGIGPNFYSLDMRVTKSFFVNRDRGTRVDVLVEGTNLLNRTNFSAVNDFFPADPFPTVGGNTLDLLNGPYNLHGISGMDPSQTLAFKSANDARQLQFGLKLIF